MTERRKAEKARREEAIRLFKEGKSYAEIGRIIGRDEHNVRKTIVRAGIADPRQFAQYYGGKDYRLEVGDIIITKGMPDGGFIYAGGFSGSAGKVLVRCAVCGTERWVNESCIRRGQPDRIRCGTCYKREVEQRQAERKKKLEEQREARRTEALFARYKTARQMTFGFSICEECGALFVPGRKGARLCSEKCKKRVYNSGKDHRIKKEAVVDKDITLERLFKRDAGICWLCGEPCDYSDCAVEDGVFHVGPRYPSIDHVIPLSRGGKHSKENVKLAHHYCNTLKNDKLIAPLSVKKSEKIFDNELGRLERPDSNSKRLSFVFPGGSRGFLRNELDLCILSGHSRRNGARREVDAPDL